MRISSGVTFFAGFLLAGCSHPYNANPISKDAIAAVQAEIKREVGDYQAASLYYKQHVDQDPALTSLPRDSAGHIIYACGHGDLNFLISKLGMELTTTADNTVKGGLAITVPIVPIAGSFAPTFDYSGEKNTTQKLNFVEYPIQLTSQDASQFTPDQQLGPITVTLLNLRGALLLGALSKPCFTAKEGAPGAGNQEFFQPLSAVESAELDFLRAAAGGGHAAPITPPLPVQPQPTPATAAAAAAKTTDDTVTLGITVTKVTDASVKISAAVVAATFLGGTAKSVSGNTITVTFKPVDNSIFVQ